MPSTRELKDELKRLGISKGLSKLTKPQLENLIKKANKPHTVNTLQDRKDLLSTISKGDLLKVIRIIRITNYSHLKHDELIDLVASKYWSDFHTRWFNQAPDKLLPYKPAKPLPNPGFSFPPEEKKEAPKKKQQNPKKDDTERQKILKELNKTYDWILPFKKGEADYRFITTERLKEILDQFKESFPDIEKKHLKKDEVKEEHKHNDNLNLEELGDIELTVWGHYSKNSGLYPLDRPTLITTDNLNLEELEAYVRHLEKILIKIKNGKLKTPNWEKETAIRLQKEAIKVLKDYMKQYKKEMFEEFPNLPKNLSFHNTVIKYSDALWKSQKLLKKAPEKKKAEKTSKEKRELLAKAKKAREDERLREFRESTKESDMKKRREKIKKAPKKKPKVELKTTIPIKVQQSTMGNLKPSPQREAPKRPTSKGTKEEKKKLTAKEASDKLQGLNQLSKRDAKKVLIDILESQRGNKDFLKNKINSHLMRQYIKDDNILKRFGLLSQEEEKKEEPKRTMSIAQAVSIIKRLPTVEASKRRIDLLKVLTNFKGDKKFYKTYKKEIDSFTSPSMRKRFGFT